MCGHQQYSSAPESQYQQIKNRMKQYGLVPLTFTNGKSTATVYIEKMAQAGLYRAVCDVTRWHPEHIVRNGFDYCVQNYNEAISLALTEQRADYYPSLELDEMTDEEVVLACIAYGYTDAKQKCFSIKDLKNAVKNLHKRTFGANLLLKIDVEKVWPRVLEVIKTKITEERAHRQRLLEAQGLEHYQL